MSTLFDQFPPATDDEPKRSRWFYILTALVIAVFVAIAIFVIVFVADMNKANAEASGSGTVYADRPLSVATSAAPAPSPAVTPADDTISDDPSAEATETTSASQPASSATATAVATSKPSPRASATATAPAAAATYPNNAIPGDGSGDVVDQAEPDPSELQLEDPPLQVHTVAPDEGAASSMSDTVIDGAALDAACQAAGYSGANVPAGATSFEQVSCNGATGAIGFDRAQLHDRCPSGEIIVQDQQVLCRVRN